MTARMNNVLHDASSKSIYQKDETSLLHPKQILAGNKCVSTHVSIYNETKETFFD